MHVGAVQLNVSLAGHIASVGISSVLQPVVMLQVDTVQLKPSISHFALLGVCVSAPEGEHASSVQATLSVTGLAG
jgi:hypothetical protein